MKTPIILTIILFTVQFLAPIFGQNEQKPQLIVQTGHTSFVDSLAFSPNGEMLASGGMDKIIILWNVKTGQQLKSFEGHNHQIWSVTFSPDNRIIASGSWDKTIKLWSIETGREIKTLIGHTDFVVSVAFSPDGKILASGSWDKTIKLWNVETGQQIKSLQGHSRPITSVIFSHDGKFFASGSGDNTIKLWKTETGQQIKLIEGHIGAVWSIAFSPDSQIIASGSADKTIRLWSVETGLQVRLLEGHTDAVATVRFSSDGKSVASSGWDKVIKLWNVETGKEIRTLVGHTDLIRSVAVSPDGKTLASGSHDGTLRLWDTASGQQIKSLENHAHIVSTVAISPDGKFIATDADKTIKLWSGKGAQQIKSLVGHTGLVKSFTFSSDSKTLISGSFDGTIIIWNSETGQQIKSFEAGSEIRELAFSPNGKIIAVITGVFGKTIELLDVETGKRLKPPTSRLDGSIFSLAFSPDGKMLAIGGGLTEINLLNVEMWQEIKSIGNSIYGNSVAFSPDGKTLATDSNTKVKLISIDSGREIKSLAGHTEFVRAISFSPDGKMLASGSEDKTMKLWNIETGQLIKSFEGHANTVSSVTFSPDGKILVTGSGDATAKLWDIKSCQLIATLISLDEEDWIVTTPDGRFDTNKLENPQGLHWIMPDAPFDPLSFEVFMRDYYEPNLLPRLLKCTEENSCEQEFKPVRNLTELNRTQPKVNIFDIKATASPDTLQVTVEVQDVVSEFQKDKQGNMLHSGVEDVRLFRDGQLVGYAPEGEGKVTLDKNGKFKKTFNVRLPKNRELKEVSFTAYAFNSDLVKSETAQKTYVLPKALPTAKGSAYIITIGVNASENSDYRLRYAANDARKLQEELIKKLPKDKYERIVQVPLISDYDNTGKTVENNATKEKIKAVLDRLAGENVSDDLLKDVPNKHLLNKVQPEDLVLLAFSGHGYASREGIFYFVPYNIGTSADILRKSISSDELSLWLRDIDAGEMMMIVDACHSAAAVQGKDFKPGPMGSRGLGQLSYDKGMRILTATQSNSLAWEPDCLQNGLLTYSLVANGLVKGLADISPKDNKLFSNEWLSFAVKDVPELYEKLEKREKGLCIGENKSGVYKVDGQKSNLNLQQPTLFDFSRRDRQYELY